jgi:hypothetical protein
MDVRFISYDGKFPNLCGGELVLAVDGIDYTFSRFALISGGDVRINGFKDFIKEGPWSVEDGYWPDGFPEEAKAESLRLIDAKIEHGCCGGCL